MDHCGLIVHRLATECPLEHVLSILESQIAVLFDPCISRRVSSEKDTTRWTDYSSYISVDETRLDLPRSPGALAAAPLSDRPLHQPRAAQTPTPCAAPALPPDTSLKSSPPAPAPTAADRPKFPEFTGHSFGNLQLLLMHSSAR